MNCFSRWNVRCLAHPLVMALLMAGCFSGHIASADTDGLLPVCADGVLSEAPFQVDVLTNYTDPIFGSSSQISALGYAEPCAQQNWTGPNDGHSHPATRAVTASAAPNVVNITSSPVSVTFTVDGAGLHGPLDLYFPPCMPGVTTAGGCQQNYSNVMYRLANGAGVFTGKWTAANVSNNDWFQFTRSTDCPTGLPGLTNPSNGSPCSYQLTFSTSVDGTPTLATAMQIAVISFAGGDGLDSTSFPGFTGYSGDADFVIPMLFLPGSTAGVTASAASPTVLNGKGTTITGTYTGALIPSSLPVLALDSRLVGTTNFSLVSQAGTNSDGNVSFNVKPKTSTEYRVRVVGGATIVSDVVRVSVLRGVTLRASLTKKTVTKNHKKTVTITAAVSGKVSPATGAKSVVVQELVKTTWKNVLSVKLSASGAYSGKFTLPKGRNAFRAEVPASNAYGLSVSASTALKGP